MINCAINFKASQKPHLISEVEFLGVINDINKKKIKITVESAKLYQNMPYQNTFCVIKANDVTIAKTPIVKNTWEPKYDHTSTL